MSDSQSASIANAALISELKAAIMPELQTILMETVKDSQSNLESSSGSKSPGQGAQRPPAHPSGQPVEGSAGLLPTSVKKLRSRPQ